LAAEETGVGCFSGTGCGTLKASMPEFCTCGAQLPPDALFCHKCGKPQRHIEAHEPETPAPETLPPTPIPRVAVAAPPNANFGNPIAVRVSVLAAMLSLPLCWIPVISVAVFIAAGSVAVYLYVRRTGQRIDWRNGLRIGWMTGLVTFVCLAVLFTVAVGVVSMAGGPDFFNQPQFKNMPMYDEHTLEAAKAMMTLPGIIQALLSTFITTMLFCGAGGALAARLSRLGGQSRY